MPCTISERKRLPSLTDGGVIVSMLTSWKEFVSGAVFAAILDAHAVESHHMLYFRRDNNCNMQDMRVIRHWVRLVQLSCATSRCDKLDEMVSL